MRGSAEAFARGFDNAQEQPLAERAARFRVHREATIPPKLALVVAPGSCRAGRLLALLFSDMVPAGGDVVELHRERLPPVLLDMRTGRWRCSEGFAEGGGLVELAAWARDRDLLGCACLLYAAGRLRAVAAPAGIAA